MAAKTRFLQVSDVMMFEMKMLGADDICEQTGAKSFICTKLNDGHIAFMSPISCECEQTFDSTPEHITYKKKYSPLSLNTLNHLAIPKDKQCSKWYSFLDPDYKYVDDSIYTSITGTQIKASQYGEFLTNPKYPDGNHYPLEQYYSGLSDMRYDRIRLYFVNGYDFSNIYGVLMRITADGVQEGVMYDLCNFFFTKSNAYILVDYLASPVIFGNNIYDRYVEINVPCLYDLINDTNDMITDLDIQIKEYSPIKLSFSYIQDDDTVVDSVEYSINELFSNNTILDKINCEFTRTQVLNGTIPTTTINSDNLGAYIAECPDIPYLEFYATWRNDPLTKDIVWQFNKGIRLYDVSMVSHEYDYEVDNDYQVQTDLKKWICMHEIKCSFFMGEEKVKDETYSMTQVFISDSDPYKFYYRPIIFDEDQGMFIDNVMIEYTMRFINVNDKVQFVKTATLSMYGNLSRFYAKGTSLKTSQMTPYKVYNKIIENKQEHTGGNNGIQKIKYTKIFYNSTEIALDNDGVIANGDYNYTLTISQAPKIYKFTFKKLQSNGMYSYMDLSNGYYKLFFKDSGGNDNTIEPTYSTNMNLYVGELEFNINSSMLSKMMSLEESERKMSIVNYNEDGSVSSMFDFMYTL